jgi:oligopeptide transport system substrate-binding protein
MIRIGPAERHGSAVLAAVLCMGLVAFAAAPAIAEQVLRRSSPGEPQTLDPQLWLYGQDGNIAQDMFQGLTTVDAAARTVPGLAESWSVSADGRRYSFRLREGLQWSDGTPLDSRDFLYSFRRLFDPATASPAAALLYVIRNARLVNTGTLPVDALGVSAPDLRSFVIELEHPAPSLTELLVHRAFPAPRHVIERHGRAWTRAGILVSNGPFTLAEWRPGQFVRLVRNPLFHDAKNVHLDAVLHIPIEDPRAALTRYRTGEIDIAITLPSELIDELRRDFGPQLRLVRQIGLEYLAFNTRRPPLDDARVRRALSMAIDRDVLGARVLRAGEPAAYGLVPPGVRDYPQGGYADFASWTQQHRLTEARALLAASGYGQQRPLTLRFRHPNGETYRRVALAVSAMWQAIGVRTELLSGDLRTHQLAIQQGDFDVARAAWYAEDTDASSFLRLLDSRAGTMNVAGFRDAVYDRELARAEMLVDPIARAAALRAAEQRAMTLQPVAPLYVYVSRRLVSPRVRGWVDNPRGVHVSRWLSLAPATR